VVRLPAAGRARPERDVAAVLDRLSGEARAYVEHPVLGPRLVESAEALLAHQDISGPEILGAIDALKLRSSMTLFAAAAPEEPVFRQVLERFYAGEPDPDGSFTAGEP
jgi:uncharacterized protein (DUF1810 family)